MDRLAPDRLLPDAAPTASVEALAYDRSLRNRRPVFALTHTLRRDEAGEWQAGRHWRGVGDTVIATERVRWAGGLRATDGAMASIGERVSAVIDGAQAHTRLTSHRTVPQGQARTLALPHPPVTLGSLPLEAAQAWHRLRRGHVMNVTYLVLKVQRSATVRLAWVDGAAGEGAVIATPVHPILRALFGSTRMVFDHDAPRLRRIEGLLDPRDLRPNGRWFERLGVIEFDRALDLSSLVAPAAESDVNGQSVPGSR